MQLLCLIFAKAGKKRPGRHAYPSVCPLIVCFSPSLSDLYSPLISLTTIDSPYHYSSASFGILDASIPFALAAEGAQAANLRMDSLVPGTVLLRAPRCLEVLVHCSQPALNFQGHYF